MGKRTKKESWLLGVKRRLEAEGLRFEKVPPLEEIEDSSVSHSEYARIRTDINFPDYGVALCVKYFSPDDLEELPNPLEARDYVIKPHQSLCLETTRLRSVEFSRMDDGTLNCDTKQKFGKREVEAFLNKYKPGRCYDANSVLDDVVRYIAAVRQSSTTG